MQTTRSLPRVLGVTGKAGAGKDTIAAHIMDTKPYVAVSFAMPLKLAIAKMFNLQPEHFQHPQKEMTLPEIGKSPRELMQTLGTEWGRNLVHPDLWLILARKNIEAVLERGMNVIITDVRFENEAAMLRGMGGSIWHVVRKSAGTPHQHASEAGIRFLSECDVVIQNNASLAELFHNVDKTLAALRSAA